MLSEKEILDYQKYRKMESLIWVFRNALVKDYRDYLEKEPITDYEIDRFMEAMADTIELMLGDGRLAENSNSVNWEQLIEIIEEAKWW